MLANGMTKQQVLLTFDRIDCSLTDKKGHTKVQLITCPPQKCSPPTVFSWLRHMHACRSSWMMSAARPNPAGVCHRCACMSASRLWATLHMHCAQCLHAHRLLAIMGPSGGGKTSLLNALAGQVPATKGMQLRGDLSLNGAPRAESAVRQAYVQQEDMFYAQLTVR